MLYADFLLLRYKLELKDREELQKIISEYLTQLDDINWFDNIAAVGDLELKLNEAVRALCSDIVLNMKCYACQMVQEKREFYSFGFCRGCGPVMDYCGFVVASKYRRVAEEA